MSVTVRTASLLAALAVGGLALTACQNDTGSSVAVNGDSVSVAATGGTVSATGGTAGGSATTAKPSASPQPKSPGKPADLPADLPLPTGRLTSVTGGAGAYVLTYTGADLAAYAAALKAAGYDVVAAAGTVTGNKGTVSVAATTIADGITVAVSGS